MAPPSVWTYIRHTLGRAFRETGQALDRVALRAHAHANRPPSVVGGDPTYKFNVGHISRHRTQMPLIRRGRPIVSPDITYLAPCASLIGYVRVGPRSSIWYGAVIRADQSNRGMSPRDNSDDEDFHKEQDEEFQQILLEQRELENQGLDGVSSGGGIFIGSDTNVQDGVVITSAKDHTIIGDFVTIGHSAQIHSAKIESHSLIGMGSILKPFSKVESYAFLGAGAVVEEGVTIPKGELWVGNPARKLRDLTQEEQHRLVYQADEYVKVAETHQHVMELGGNVPDTIQLKESIQLIENTKEQHS